MKKKLVPALLLGALSVLFLPFNCQIYKDGGTTVLTSLTYKIIKWHRLNDPLYAEDEYKTGTEVHFFPNNFKDIDDYERVIR